MQTVIFTEIPRTLIVVSCTMRDLYFLLGSVLPFYILAIKKGPDCYYSSTLLYIIRHSTFAVPTGHCKYYYTSMTNFIEYNIHKV